MPEVPTVDAPSVPQSGAPIGVSAPADAFGANVIAGGLDKIGAAVGVDSDTMAKHAAQFQMINNKAEADSGFTSQLQQSDQYVADFKSNNMGKAAVTNLPQAMQDLAKQRDTIGATMSNPMAQSMYDADSRRALANNTGELTRFAATENKKYNLQQASAAQEALASDSVIHLENFDANMASMQERQLYINTQLGLSPEQGELEARKLYGNTVQMVSKTLAGNGNITAASAFLESHKEGMDGKIYEDTLMQLKPAMLANDAAIGGSQAASDALHGLNSPVGPTTDYLSNVHGREGDAKNPNSSADGIGQFTQDTWTKLMQKPEFAQDVAGKTPAQVLAMRHDPTIANRAILSYAQENAQALSAGGYHVNSASVGLLHAYGPGAGTDILNASDQNPSQKIDDIIGHQTAVNNRVSGQTVTQVVAGFTQRFGTGSGDANNNGTPTAAQIKSRLGPAIQLAQQYAAAKYPGNQAIADQYVAKAQTDLLRQASAAADTESAAYQTLGQVARDNQIQDLPTLLKTVPNGLQMYNSLPLSQTTSLQANIHHNATEITSSRANNIEGLNGMYALKSTDPQQFLNQDIANMDLPLNQKIAFLKKQDDLRAKPAAPDPTDKLVSATRNSIQYHSLVGPDGLNLTRNSQDEMHLLGTLSGQITAWQTAHPGQAPQQKDMQGILAQAAAQHSTHYYVGNFQIPGTGGTSPAYDVPDEDKTAITAALQKHNLPVSDYNIARYHAIARGVK